jgi:uncharacterized protein YjiK
MNMAGSSTVASARRLRIAVTLAAALCAMSFGPAASGSSDDIHLRFAGSERIADRDHDFTEVSGLSLARDGGFWAVSDNTARLFRLDAAGQVQAGSSIDAETDLEGVALDVAGGRILAVRESKTEILSFSDDGRMVRHRLLSMEGAGLLAPHFSASSTKDGLEGVTVNPGSGAVYVLKERRPRLLIEISPDLAQVRRVIPLTASAGFESDTADDDHLDVSGLAWDARRRGLWITSDTGKALYFYSLITMQARGWALVDEAGENPGRVSNAEGVALSTDGKTVFVVTDDGKTSRLLTYRTD